MVSCGEQQLVMIARILAQNPKIILFDEPTAHLDYYYQVKVMGIIKDSVAQGFTIVTILHDPNLALMYGDRCYFLKHGELLESGSETGLDDADLLEQVYGMALETVRYLERQLVVPRWQGGEGIKSAFDAK